MAKPDGWAVVTSKLKEASANDLSHQDIYRWLSDACSEMEGYACLVNFIGDGAAGDVIYACGGDLMQAPYTISMADGKSAAVIDAASAKEVLPRITYILKAGDEDAKESADIDIVGDSIPLKEGAVGQDGSAYLKLIAPGRGSSGWYPAEVLERDGPKAFPKGTKNFWNHQTDAEEAARPEGDLRDLASVLSEDAHYERNGPAGPGLYAKAEVQPPFRGPVDSLAKHIGMSIRATGKAKEGKAPDGKTGPIIEQLTRGISVDYVTTPGAGGKILQLFEAARVAKPNIQENDVMEAAELQKLQESVRRAEESTRKANQRLAGYEARDHARAAVGKARLPEPTQQRLLERLVALAPITIDGNLDLDAFGKVIEAEIKDEAAYLAKLTEGRVVTGMGAAPAAEPEKPEKFAERYDAEVTELADVLGLGEVGRKVFVAGRVA